MSKFGRKKPPKGWDYIEPVMTALDEELREAVNAPHEGKRKVETLWPIHQINNQRTRYIYDLYHKHKRISRELYDYCLREKLVDAKLIAKWKKPGYERLCSTYVINPKNYNFGGVSICRVPRYELEPGRVVQDIFCGCIGCASGPGGYSNIFGNKYGQNLADIQVAREDRAAARAAARAAGGAGGDDAGGEAAGDDEKRGGQSVWADESDGPQFTEGSDRAAAMGGAARGAAGGAADARAAAAAATAAGVAAAADDEGPRQSKRARTGE